MKLFINDLQKTGKLDGVSYTYWDESYTSKVGLYGDLNPGEVYFTLFLIVSSV